MAKSLYGDRQASVSYSSDGTIVLFLRSGEPTAAEPYRLIAALTADSPGAPAYQVSFPTGSYLWDPASRTLTQFTASVDSSGTVTEWPVGATSHVDTEALKAVAEGSRPVPVLR